ncbi:MAG: Uma2 family endonuclease [Hormoscilla sp. SP5CHS1]|nr:Uma2 family endonuclease [Hormoscilla sp. SP12CHS1]MBC6454641.1 Uma2 family endonuclease [Hormoscilla sp. SP5CHS1]
MTSTSVRDLTLEAFLKLPYIEESPAWEYNGQKIQKPMPQTQHSRLQFKLCEAINQVGEDREIACAFPELRCTFGDRSLFPDISILRWERIPMTVEGDLINKFNSFPDWTIEIISPDQSANCVTAKILHCLKYGSQLGWLLDPSDRSVLVFLPRQEPTILSQRDHLPVLTGMELEMNAMEIFAWLKMKPKRTR